MTTSPLRAALTGRRWEKAQAIADGARVPLAYPSPVATRPGSTCAASGVR